MNIIKKFIDDTIPNCHLNTFLERYNRALINKSELTTAEEWNLKKSLKLESVNLA